MNDAIIRKVTGRNLIFGPLAIFFIVWNIVLFLYSLHFSKLLYYSTLQAFFATYLIIASFFIGWLIMRVVTNYSQNDHVHTITESFISQLIRRVKIFFWFWSMMTVFEVVYCQGVPVLWLIIGNGKTYFDFGIASIHGFLNSLILATSLVSYYLYLMTGNKRHLLIPLFACFWALIVISRNLLIVNVIQMAILHFYFTKINYYKFAKSILLLLILILIFGVVGDARTGKTTFFELAAVNDNYPDWLPSGFLWVYMYLVTPLNNLIHVFNTISPEWNIGLDNSTILLIPSFLRNLIYGDLTYDSTYYLVTQAFNVSTAYIDPYRDLGYIGVFLLAFFSGFFVTFLQSKKDTRSVLCFCVLMQCNMLSVFYNHYMYLPIIFQLVVIYFCFIARYDSRIVKYAETKRKNMV
ncbi:O-antigen polymerase [Kosakonia oryziphila]|uniref:Oligosaccharide repeat unit polymerase n=1 Tax=Kosakonia oryziphila TaxID=1005667 RepID=A0A1C4ALA0_9ENTR|nr:O-antigen polymerase [Kosakonia oryziphila]SCB95328.1 oligosaccharide repeat unit polymerase [Kosakonia oryziphila]